MNEISVSPEAVVLVAPVHDRIGVITLNRPHARNALSLDVIVELHAAIDKHGRDHQCAAIVLAASGSVFCAGHDLKEMTAHRADADGGEAFFAETMSACSAMMQAIVACPKPVIAAVQGMATAAGCQLVASADLAIAADSATFATPGVNIGLFCSTPMVALSRNIPRKQAMEMLLLGDTMSASDAALYGLINHAVPAAEVLPKAMNFASRIATKSSAIVGIGKAAFYRQIDLGLAAAYTDATKIMVSNMLLEDASEGICAFLDKRQPTWPQR